MCVPSKLASPDRRWANRLATAPTCRRSRLVCQRPEYRAGMRRCPARRSQRQHDGGSFMWNPPCGRNSHSAGHAGPESAFILLHECRSQRRERSRTRIVQSLADAARPRPACRFHESPNGFIYKQLTIEGASFPPSFPRGQAWPPRRRSRSRAAHSVASSRAARPFPRGRSKLQRRSSQGYTGETPRSRRHSPAAR